MNLPSDAGRLTPELSVADFARSLDWYVRVLGATIAYQRPESAFAMLSLHGHPLMLEQCNGHWVTGALEYPLGRGVNFQIDVDQLDPILATLRAASWPLFREPMENWYRAEAELQGSREFLVQDPDGYLLRFSEDLGSKPV